MSTRRGILLQRIMDRCEITPAPEWMAPELGPCWLWQGPTSGAPGRGREKGRGHSYGRVTVDGCTMAVHRVTWQCENGPISPKRHLDHLCRRRNCASPLHCENVTHKKNQKRKVRDDR